MVRIYTKSLNTVCEYGRIWGYTDECSIEMYEQLKIEADRKDSLILWNDWNAVLKKEA